MSLKRELILKSAESSLNDYNSGKLNEETADELIQRLSGNLPSFNYFVVGFLGVVWGFVVLP